MSPTPDHLVLALYGLQALWVVFMIVLAWALRRVLRDIEQNTEATKKIAADVQGIGLLLAGQYVTRREHEILQGRVRDTELALASIK